MATSNVSEMLAEEEEDVLQRHLDALEREQANDNNNNEDVSQNNLTTKIPDHHPTADDTTDAEGHLVDEDDDIDRVTTHQDSHTSAMNLKLTSPTSPKPSPTTSKHKKKRDISSMRKAPQAPKRFKSSYICFFTSKQPEIKKELGEKATVMEISKRSAQMWKELSMEDRAYWDDVAAKDKERYMIEKASYTGPWQIPYKRAKKDPTAPKRPMSAFLLFSQGRRGKVKEANPGLKNTEVSRLLGKVWRDSTDDEKKLYIEQEKELREEYKIALKEWQEKDEIRRKEEAKARLQQLEWQRQQMQQANEQYALQQQQQTPPANMHPRVQQYPPAYMHPPQGYPPFQQPMYPQQYSNYPGPSGSYQYTGGGKQQPVILGPNGMPHYQQYYSQHPPAPPPPPQSSMYNQPPPPPPPPPPPLHTTNTFDDRHEPIPVQGSTFDEIDHLDVDPAQAD